MQLARFLLAAAFCGVLFPARALLIRADRDDAEYLELATRYTAAVALPGGGEAVLIAPGWLLTSAKQAKALRADARIAIGAKSYSVAATRIHPAWSGGAANDIALVHLRGGVPDDIEPLRLYRGDNEGGKAVVIVAHGQSGTIGGPAALSDRRARAAINTIDRIAARAFDMRIKPPEEASDLQGALTPGEIGAPAIVETTQGLFVVGVATAIDGEWETYARVSAYASWIEATMVETAKREVEQLLDPDRR